MLFPQAERVIYKQNPLQEVICQFRFPKILKIREETPVDFQEAIRSQFPLFGEKSNEGVITLPPEIAQIMPPEIAGIFSQSDKAYEFISRNKSWSISLTPDFLALTDKSYKRWEEFRLHLQHPYDALIRLYEPSFLTRIGLRYQNVIVPSKLGFENVKWSELINPTLASFLASDKETAVEDITQVAILLLGNNGGKVRIQHGLVRNTKTNEVCYMIDSDFFTEQEEDIENGLNIIETFKQENTNLFRWCITDRVHEALGPRPL